MNIDVSKIIENKLNALEAEGVIRKKIEDAVEKSITAAITSELESWSFREGIGTDFEAFICNLFYNETEIIVDLDDVDDSDYFDIDV